MGDLAAMSQVISTGDGLAMPAPGCCCCGEPICTGEHGFWPEPPSGVLLEEEAPLDEGRLPCVCVQPWNNSRYHSVPYALRGQRIISNEPWIEAVGKNPEIDFATTGFNKLDDGQRDTPAELFNRRK